MHHSTFSAATMAQPHLRPPEASCISPACYYWQEAQLDTLREAVSIDAICDPGRAVAAESSGGSVGGNSTDADAAIVGAAIGGAVGGVLLIGCIAFACCFMKKGRASKPPPQAAARNCGTAAAVNQYTQPGVQMAQAPVVQGFAVGGAAVPMGQAVA
jgi:hypothetical protein